MPSQRVLKRSYDLLLKGMLSHSVEQVSVEQLSQMSDLQLLDCREPDEYVISHLPGALNVGYKDFHLYSISDLDPLKTTVVYCSIGYRSEKVGEKLKKHGFANVLNLYGGIFEWVNRNLEVYNVRGQTNDIHPYSWVWGKWLSGGVKKMRV